MCIIKRKLIPYNPNLKQKARELRNNSTLSEVLLWKELKGKKMKGYDFHRQKPINNFIVDFYCNELNLAIEIDGSSHNEKVEYDENREKVLESLGIKLLKYYDGHIKNYLSDILSDIAENIEELERINTPLPPLKRGIIK